MRRGRVKQDLDVGWEGRSCLITEHGAYDGINSARLSERIARAIDDYSGGDMAPTVWSTPTGPALAM